MPDALDRARQVKDNLRASHGTDSRVRGIGVAPRADGFAVRVLVADAAAATDLALPAELDGVPVDVVVIGDVRATD